MKVYKDCRNPVLPPELCIPDPEAHVMHDGRVYIYGSWDQTPDIYCSPEYRVFSSSNMVDWIDHDKSFDTSQVTWVSDKNAPQYTNVDWDFKSPTPFLQGIMQRMLEKLPPETKEEIQKNGFPEDFSLRRDEPKTPYLLYAPDVLHKDGKYYLYFCTSNSEEGVAVSEKPEGPFVNPVQLPCGGIDPAVFIDDDGQAYFIWGQFRASGAILNESMTGFVEGSIVHRIVTEEEHGFHEGSSLRKRNGIYYFVYPCIYRKGVPTSLAYATSDRPLGPYTYRGIIIDNATCDPKSWNIHGSIEEVNGQWYVFYHRSSGNSSYLRRLCIEPIFFNDDGTINEVKMTSQGAGRPFGLDEPIEGYRACELKGKVYIDKDTLTGMGNGDSVIFRYVNWEHDADRIQVEATGSGEIMIYVDEVLAGNVRVENGKTITSFMSGPAGKHTVQLTFNYVNNMKLKEISFPSN